MTNNLIDPNIPDDRIGKDFKRNYPGMKCKEPNCANTDLQVAFWGNYCVPCALFHKNKKKNNSQACKNFMDKIKEGK